MVGYFTSGSLSELARSIACYLKSRRDSVMRLIISPNLSEQDVKALRFALENQGNMIPILFPDFHISEDSLRANCVKALCYLVASGRLDVKVAFQTEGLFHTKCWLFELPKGNVAVHGSSNATKSGLLKNFEQLAVSRSWLGEDSRQTYIELKARFDDIWCNNYGGITCSPLSNRSLDYVKEVSEKIKVVGPELESAFLESLCADLLKELSASREEDFEYRAPKLSIPPWLNFQDGPFRHQGDAIAAWEANERRGILSIATGGGKTLTSLVAAARLQKICDPLFILIVVPTNPLAVQWLGEVKEFGVQAKSSSDRSGGSSAKQLKDVRRNLSLHTSTVEIFITTYDSLSGSLAQPISDIARTYQSLIIADEVHNMGSARFVSKPPDDFKFRLGLSATYERQFDDDGTAFLLAYFGGAVYEYSLKEAIGRCLVPFDYFPNRVGLDPSEEQEFLDLTYEIRKLAYAFGASEGDSSRQKLDQLIFKRRRIIEAASQKVTAFKALLPVDKRTIKRTLVFCTDKHPEQLDDVNLVLNELGLQFHQVTQEETGNRTKLNSIIQEFSSGNLQALTSKRVLDEGFNVPQTEVAYLLANQTGVRQWVQRLGRVLRLSPKTNKSKALVYDFVVMPPVVSDVMDEDYKLLVKNEYDRVAFFSEHSENGLERGGSILLMQEMMDLLRKQ